MRDVLYIYIYNIGGCIGILVCFEGVCGEGGSGCDGVYGRCNGYRGKGREGGRYVNGCKWVCGCLWGVNCII